MRAMAIPHDTDPYARLAAASAAAAAHGTERRPSADAPALRRRRGPERRPDDRDERATLRRPRSPPGGAPPRRRREGAVHHAHADAVRGALRGGAGADRGERRHDPRAGRDRLPRRAGRARAVRGAGADVDGERVRFPRGLCRQLVQATAPQTFTQVARNPAHSVDFGGTSTIFAPAYGSPFVRDLDDGRRYGTIEDFRNFVKLAYAVAVPAPLRRHRLRAGRPAGQQAPLRHGLRAPALHPGTIRFRMGSA